jgi:hypothetical protein
MPWRGISCVTESELREDRELVGGVDAFHVVRRVRFGEPQALRRGERAFVRCAVEHFGEDEVRRAVEHAADFENLFARERFGDRSHDRNGATDGGFVGDRDAAGRRERAELRASRREKIFVRRNDVFAGAQRGDDELGRDSRSADALDHDVDRRIVHERARVFGKEIAWNLRRARFRERSNRDTCEPIIDAAASGNRRCRVDEESRDAAANRPAP